MKDILIGNPLGWVQSQLLGGWRRALTIGVFYLLVALGIMMIIYRAVAWNPNASAQATLYTFTRTALVILFILQAAMFCFVASSTISKAVQKDLTGGMIDSHRQTPMSGVAIVLGYLTGPNVLLAPVTLANALLALGLSLVGGHPPEMWFMGALVFFCIGFTMASLSLLLGMCTRKSGNVMGLFVVLSMFSGSIVVFLIPGLGLLTGFFSGVSTMSPLFGAIAGPIKI